jgi:hypothetical protein
MRSIWHEEKTRRLFRRAYEGLHTRKSRKIGKEFTQEKNPIETGKKKKEKENMRADLTVRRHLI